MSIFENLTKKVTETARAAAKKSNKLVEVTKLNMNIAAEEDKIRKLYGEIGKMVYETYENTGEVPDKFRELCERIKEHNDNICEMKQKILELKNIKYCPGCNAELERDVAFCPKCGTKQEIPQPEVAEEEEPEENKCPSCGAEVGEDAAYCSKCGCKL